MSQTQDLLSRGHLLTKYILNSAVGVGVCVRNTATDEFPGWTKGSWGYHSDDGNKYEYHDAQFGQEYGETAGAGDVIGCQLDCRVGELSFNRDQESFGMKKPCCGMLLAL